MAQRITKIRSDRLKKKEELLKLGVNPYPSSISLKGERVAISHARGSLGKNVLVAGRIRAIRIHGGASFLDLEDFTASIQLLSF